MKPSAPANFRSGYVAIIGEPNAGKSTLLNAFLREKISIVTPKPQTTRQRVIGIYNDETTQIIFHDTPGLIKPSYLLQSHMMKAALASSKDADLALVLHAGSDGETLPALVLEQLPRLSRARKFLVLNKSDELSKDQIRKQEHSFASLVRNRTFDRVFSISALKEQGTEELLAAIKEAMPIHPPYYPQDILSEYPEKFFAAEFIREAIFLHYGQEIPYSAAVEIIDYKEREKGKTYIAANILVERESQKKIVIGKGGSALKKTGQHARQQIEQFIGTPVFLELFVKIAEQWRSKESSLQWLGYSAPEES